MMVFLGNHLFEGEVFLSLVSFCGQLRGVCVARETPDLVCRIFDQRCSEEVTALFAVRRKLAECRKLIRIARDFHFARFPIDERVDLFQPWEPKDERFGSQIRDEHVD